MPSFAAIIDSMGLRHINVATPTAGTDAANKDYVDRIKSGQINVTIANGSSTGTATLTFASAFPTAPHVTGNAETANWNVAFGTITTSNCVVTVRHVDAATTGGTATVHWIAMP